MQLKKSLAIFAVSAASTYPLGAFARERCQWIFEKPPLIAPALGVLQTGVAERPVGISVVKSRYQSLEKTINQLATWILGPAVRLKDINQALRKYEADRSGSPYWVRLANAFDFQLKFDEAFFQKAVPAKGPLLILLNHPLNGSDGIALAAAISKIRPDVKVVMTPFLKDAPGMSENAIFLNPYGGPEAKAFNASRKLEMQEHVKNGGALVIFASGEVSMKQAGTTDLPMDPPWKKGASEIIKNVPEAKVIPAFVGGEASPSFYKVSESGIDLLRTIFHVREISKNIAREIPLHFSTPIDAQVLMQKFPLNPREMMQYLRARTYLLSESQVSKKVTEQTARVLEPIAEPKDPQYIYGLIKKDGRLLFEEEKRAIQVYHVEGSKMHPEVLQDLGIAREKSFRSVGEGSGKKSDTDSYDLFYDHIIAVDSGTGVMLGAYRIGKVDEIIQAKGYEGLYTSQYYHHHEMVMKEKHTLLEVGRSFANMEAGAKTVVALDRLWKGIAAYVADNPTYRKLMGAVSISNEYSATSKLLMLKFLEERMHPEYSRVSAGKTALDIETFMSVEINQVAQKVSDLRELNRIVGDIDGTEIPSLLISYNKLGAQYIAFDRDVAFNTIDGLILVDFLSPAGSAEISKHFLDRWEGYRKFHGFED